MVQRRIRPVPRLAGAPHASRPPRPDAAREPGRHVAAWHPGTDRGARALLEAIQAVVWRADARCDDFRFVSRAAEPLLGLPAARWYERHFWRDHVHPEDRGWVIAQRSRACRAARDHDLEYRLVGAGGRVVWVHDVARVLPGADGPRLVGVMFDVTEKKHAEAEIRRSRELLRDLTGRLEWVREQERSSLAREMHDGLGQPLTALRMELAGLRRRVGRATGSRGVVARVRGMESLVEEAQASVRRLCAELRPGVLDHLGLPAAVEWEAREFARRSGVRVVTDVAADGLNPSRETATAVFRVLQEALTNVYRHANARRVHVALHRDGARLVLEVTDDGRGIRADQAVGRQALGLLGMRERARRLGGHLAVRGRAGHGTAVTLNVPAPGSGS